ncbi:MAG: peptidyl-prolyl cis-trans isomerase [Alphaproteobacteria bacterium]|nr:peptidyl-prolyl cis-trans isomerase [Alphaproteobacteria bacterium]
MAARPGLPRATLLLLAGAGLGLGGAMWTALGVGRAVESYGDAIAVVDGTPIARSVFDSAIEGLASAKRTALTEAEKREALDRIIDEELLLQRALELGLGESDPPSRKALVNAMLQFSIADASRRTASDAELRAFYAERPKLIAPQPLLSVRGVSFSAKDEARARAFKAALDAGTAFEAAVRQTGAEGLLLPGGPVIPSKIAEYAGASVRDAALSLQPGQSIGPLAIANRLVFVHVVARTETPPPPLEEVRDVVREEWQKRETEKAFAAYVEGLRRKARISYDAAAPKGEGGK